MQLELLILGQSSAAVGVPQSVLLKGSERELLGGRPTLTQNHSLPPAYRAHSQASLHHCWGCLSTQEMLQDSDTTSEFLEVGYLYSGSVGVFVQPFVTAVFVASVTPKMSIIGFLIPTPSMFL